jgi:phage host-nuclease inhibitor protein Gam
MSQRPASPLHLQFLLLRNDMEDQETDEASEDFRITDPAELDWAMARLAALRKERADNEAAADLAIWNIKLRLAKLNASVDRGIAFFASHIEAYCRQNRRELLGGGKRQARTFLHGIVRWRKSGGAPLMHDKAAVLAWAQTQPLEAGFLRIKEEPAWDAIKEHCKKTGELPPGVEMAPESEEFEIETKELNDGSAKHTNT